MYSVYDIQIVTILILFNPLGKFKPSVSHGENVEFKSMQATKLDPKAPNSKILQSYE